MYCIVRSKLCAFLQSLLISDQDNKNVLFPRPTTEIFNNKKSTNRHFTASTPQFVCFLHSTRYTEITILIWAHSVASPYQNSVHTPQKMRHVMAQLVEALYWNPESRGFESRWCQWNFSLIMVLGSRQLLTEMSTRNISWGVKAVGA